MYFNFNQPIFEAEFSPRLSSKLTGYFIYFTFVLLSFVLSAEG